MDNGYQLFAKLPNPNAGPARFTVASEVATRELLHDWFGLPVPRVLAWSCDANDNPVEAEYILEEKASGVRLGSVWKQWPRESKLRLITQVADIENTLTSVRFPTHGSVYFKNDLRRFIGKADELELPSVAPEISTRYSMGPLTSAELWNSARKDMNLDRGPLYYQSDVPRMFKHPGHVREGWVLPQRPDDFDTLKDEEQKQLDDELESETMHKYYEAQVCKRAPLHWAVLQQRNVQVIRKPVWLVTGAWENRDLFFLRESLMSLAVDWEDLFPVPETPCPITFSSKDIEVHAQEQENMEGVGQMLKLFRDQAVLSVDGMVDPQDYEIARKNCQKCKDIFIGLAKDDDEREWFAKLWPYQSIE